MQILRLGNKTLPGTFILLMGVLAALPVFGFDSAPEGGGRDAGANSFGPPPGDLLLDLGNLLVTTYPAGARVRVDSELQGVTPLAPLPLKSGWHLVQAEKAGLFASTRVRVGVGELTTVELTLNDGRGTFWVFSTPEDALVILDGEEKGHTPLHLPVIPAGDHDLRIHHEGFADYRATVEIRAGEESRLDARLLVPAKLVVRSEPAGARVYFGDHPKGQTPAIINSVRPGRTEVTLNLENHQVWTQTIEFTEGASETLAVELEAERTSIHLLSSPPGARIEMDGELLGTTPLRWAVPLGERRFVFRLPGYEEYRLRTDVLPGANSDLRVTLNPLRGYVTLRGTSPAGATVALLDESRETWRAPVLAQPVVAGMRTFRLRAPGYRTIEIEANVLPNEEILLEPEWAPKSDEGGFYRILIPGWSQRHQEKRIRSILLPAAQLGSLFGLLITTDAYNEAVKEYDTAWNRYLNQVSPETISSAWDEAHRRHDRVEDRKATRRMFLAASVGIYLYSLVDAALLVPERPESASAGLSLTGDPSTGMLTLGVRVPF